MYSKKTSVTFTAYECVVSVHYTLLKQSIKCFPLLRWSLSSEANVTEGNCELRPSSDNSITRIIRKTAAVSGNCWRLNSQAGVKSA